MRLALSGGCGTGNAKLDGRQTLGFILLILHLSVSDFSRFEKSFPPTHVKIFLKADFRVINGPKLDWLFG